VTSLVVDMFLPARIIVPAVAAAAVAGAFGAAAAGPVSRPLAPGRCGAAPGPEVHDQNVQGHANVQGDADAQGRRALCGPGTVLAVSHL
jgi:hypothetical protein